MPPETAAATSANRVREKLERGETATCLWLHLGSVAAADVAADAASNSGADALVFDVQHGLWTRDTLEAAIGLTRGRAVPLVRTAENSPVAIGQALDAGALGVIVPLVESAEEAARAAAASRYPPVGVRSGGGIRPLMDFPGYVETADSAILTAVMIETAKGVENAEAIAAVEGIDFVFVGTTDLALSLGTFPDTGTDTGTDTKSRHAEAMARILAACRAAGKPCGAFTATPETARRYREQGYRVVTLGTDDGFIRAGARAALEAFNA